MYYVLKDGAFVVPTDLLEIVLFIRMHSSNSTICIEQKYTAYYNIIIQIDKWLMQVLLS